MTDITTLTQTIANITDLKTLESLKADVDNIYQFRLAQSRYLLALQTFDDARQERRNGGDDTFHYERAADEFYEASRLYEHAREYTRGGELVLGK